MGYFSDSQRNWASAFWAATAIPLVLDPSNLIWDESGWWEEQFGAPLAPLGPSGGNDYFTPNFWAGRGSETVGRRGPGTSLKVFPIIRGTCSAQSSKLILPKMLPWTPSLKGTGGVPWVQIMENEFEYLADRGGHGGHGGHLGEKFVKKYCS